MFIMRALSWQDALDDKPARGTMAWIAPDHGRGEAERDGAAVVRQGVRQR